MLSESKKKKDFLIVKELFISSMANEMELSVPNEFSLKMVKKDKPSPKKIDCQTQVQKNSVLTEEVLAHEVGTIHFHQELTLGKVFKKDSSLAYIKALGVKIEIKNKNEGELEGILVKEGDLVDYGKKLFVFRRHSA